MRSDPHQIRDTLSRHPPFDRLPPALLDAWAAAVRVRRLDRGATLFAAGDTVREMCLLVAGALEAVCADGTLEARLGEGDSAGAQALLTGGAAGTTVTAIEDATLYAIAAPEFHRLRAAHPATAGFFAPPGAARLRHARAAAGHPDGSGALVARRVHELIGGDAVVTGPDTSIAEAARLMAARDVSCLPVVEDGALVGILTDRDLRRRVLAAGRDPVTPVRAVMSTEPVRIEEAAWLFQAHILMLRHDLHHLPVMRGRRLVGVLSSTDLLRTQLRSVAYIAADIGQQDDAEGVAAVLRRAPAMLRDLVDGGASAYAIGHSVSSLADAATLRLCELAEARLGPPPVPYAWLALGSQGRNEQTARTDQDNALILDDAYRPAEHDAWFAAFADSVCDGLALAGYAHCPGLIMAKNPAWRMTLADWQRTFRRWIEEPEPVALLNASVFFDMRPVTGRAELFERLQATVLRLARGSGFFLGHLAANAMTHQPPLGIFRNLVLISGGEHHRTLDLKMSGLVPIIDLARVYGLSAGIAESNSHDRLMAASEAGRISREGARDLTDALEFLGLVRLRHQASRLKAGADPDNYLLPGELSPFERGHLRDAFAVVKTMQASAVAAFRGGFA